MRPLVLAVLTAANLVLGAGYLIIARPRGSSPTESEAAASAGEDRSPSPERTTAVGAGTRGALEPCKATLDALRAQERAELGRYARVAPLEDVYAEGQAAPVIQAELAAALQERASSGPGWLKDLSLDCKTYACRLRVLAPRRVDRSTLASVQQLLANVSDRVARLSSETPHAINADKGKPPSTVYEFYLGLREGTPP
jgi:hypothetical protein